MIRKFELNDEEYRGIIEAIDHAEDNAIRSRTETFYRLLKKELKEQHEAQDGITATENLIRFNLSEDKEPVVSDSDIDITDFAGDIESKLPEDAWGLEVWTDGSCHGNPGPGGIGLDIKATTNVMFTEDCATISEPLTGEVTNNEAEYIAVKTAVTIANEIDAIHTLSVMCDSQLVVKQLNQEWDCNNDALREHYDEITAMIGEFKEFSINHVPREQNETADELANTAAETAA